MKQIINYLDAVKYCGNSYVLMNDVIQVALKFDDFDFLDDIHQIEIEDSEDDSVYHEIYQYFVSDCSDSDVEYLRSRFGLSFAWCDCLSVWVLCVTHFGTSWDSVPVTDSAFENENRGE